jgi:hypothetical protein
MNPQQAENLRILIRHMETKVTRTLSMDAITGPCGTPACAFGEAACMPHFNALGLVALPKSSFCSVAWHGKETMLGSCADEIFGTEDSDKTDSRSRLFGAGRYNAWHRNAVSPQEWAQEARKVLAENGYTMDDGFAAFMVKVREPVALTATV